MTPQEMASRGAAIIEERRVKYRRVDDVTVDMLVQCHREEMEHERRCKVEVLRTIAVEHQRQIAEKDAVIAAKDAEIARLTWLLKGTDD